MQREKMRIAQTVLSVFAAFNIFLFYSAEASEEAKVEKEFQEKIDYYEEFQYTQTDIDKIKKYKNIKYIIAAVHRMEFGINVDPLSFMKPYLEEIQKYPSGLSLYINYILQSARMSGKHADKETELLLQKMIKMHPENGYAYYLAAYYYSINDNLEKCLEYTKKAANAKIFENYWKELSEYLIETSIFLGYTKNDAYKQALPLSHNTLMYRRTCEYILNNQENRENIFLCKKVGDMLHVNSNTILERILGLNIKNDSINMLDSKEFEKEKKLIEEETKEISSFMQYLNDARENSNISEKRWEQYGSDLFQHSEFYAIKKLMAEYPAHI
jgi:uncharacterized protein YifE (UPF0438 family)